MRTDGRMDTTKLIVAFRNFAKAPNSHVALRFKTPLIYRAARSRLTHFKFEYCAGARACRGWR